MVLRYNSGNKGGIRLSKLNYSYHRFLNNNRNKGIPNLMLWICIGNALVYFLSQFGTPLSLYSALSFDPQAIAHGQVWRLFSYIFTFAGIGDMSIYSIFSVALALYCSYWPARYLEQLWGSLRVNLYYLIGILAMDVYAMLVYFLFHVSYGVSALYLNLSMFLSVAALMPEARGLLFFFIPVNALARPRGHRRHSLLSCKGHPRSRPVLDAVWQCPPRHRPHSGRLPADRGAAALPALLLA